MKIPSSLFRSLVAVAAVCSLGAAQAQMTPLGLWHSIDDKTGLPKGEIRIADVGAGELNGKVERSLLKDAKPDDKCDQCTDDRKDKPKVGLEIIRGARQVEGKDVWEGGTIVDPDNGKIYKLKMTPIEGGSKLEVRGFIGFALLGRTQTWVRVP
jgi:uncharacterized protein (DUF2147 family)